MYVCCALEWGTSKGTHRECFGGGGHGWQSELLAKWPMGHGEQKADCARLVIYGPDAIEEVTELGRQSAITENGSGGAGSAGVATPWRMSGWPWLQTWVDRPGPDAPEHALSIRRLPAEIEEMAADQVLW